MTNYEYIKNMSVEEMAVTIMCPNEMGMAEIPCDHSDDKNRCECCLEWLRAEIEGTTPTRQDDWVWIGEPEPLTLAQLQRISAGPVWIVNQSEHPENCRSCWEIVSGISEGILFLKGTDYCYRLDTYGETWVAYDRKPEEGHNG